MCSASDILELVNGLLFYAILIGMLWIMWPGEALKTEFSDLLPVVRTEVDEHWTILENGNKIHVIVELSKGKPLNENVTPLKYEFDSMKDFCQQVTYDYLFGLTGKHLTIGDKDVRCTSCQFEVEGRPGEATPKLVFNFYRTNGKVIGGADHD